MYELKKYAELERYCKHFADGAWTCLVVVGPPGVSKSTTMRAALPKNTELRNSAGARWIESHVSAFQLYKELHSHLHRTFVLDDVDHLCKDKDIVKLLKCLCNTEPTRRIYWGTAAAQLEKEEIPREFDTTSKVALILNRWDTVDENVGALEDRGMVVRFAPTPAEVHRFVGKWFEDEKVYRHIESCLARIYNPSVRLYVIASKMRELGEDWRGWIESKIALPDEMAIVRDLRADGSLPNEQVRFLKYNSQTGKSRASYFRVVADLKALEDAAGFTRELQPKRPHRRTRPPLALARSQR